MWRVSDRTVIVDVATEPPLYCVIAAGWAGIGQRLGGFETLAYWIRALDAAIVGLLVIVAAVFGRLCDPVLLFGAATAS